MHGFFVHRVAGRTGDGVQCLHQRHAGLEGHRQRPRETCDGRVVHDLPDHRDFQDHAVEEVLERQRALLEEDEAEDGGEDGAEHEVPVRHHEARGAHDDLGEGRQVGTELLEDSLELRHHEDQQDGADQKGDRDHHGRIEQGLLDLALQRLDVFLVAGDGVQHGFQHARAFAGADQVAVQLVELHRVLADGFGQRGAAFDVVADVLDQLLHADVLLPALDDLQRGDDGHAGLHHRRQLATEEGDLLWRHRLARRAEQRLGLHLHHGRGDALLAQLRAQEVGVLGRLLALHLDAALVGAFPDEQVQRVLADGRGRFLDGGTSDGHSVFPCPAFPTRTVSTHGSRLWRGGKHPACDGGRVSSVVAAGTALRIMPALGVGLERPMGAMLFFGQIGARASRAWPAPTGLDWAAVSRRGRRPQSLVTRLISARLVTPLRTFISADWRRSRMPAFWATAAICMALPPSSTMAWMSSDIGMTW